MLPHFQVRGLRCCATDLSGVSDDSYADILASDDGRSSIIGSCSVPACEHEYVDVKLKEKEEYDRIIKDHPEAKLVYVDEDDGDTIEVGSSAELYTRVKELLPQNPIVFDLQNPKKGLPVWEGVLQRMHRRQRQRSPDTSISSVIEAPVPVSIEHGLLVDLSPEDAAPTVLQDLQEERKPFLAMFENELSRLMGGASDLEAIGDAAAEGSKYTMRGALPSTSPEAAPSSLPERHPTLPIELPAEAPEASSTTEESPHSNPLAQFIAGFPARKQQLFTSLRSSILALAQTSASAARTAASLSRDFPAADVQNGIETIRSLLDTAAREAAAAAAQAAEATISNTNELQNFVGTVKNTVKEVGEAYQHVGQVVGGEVTRAVRDVVEGTIQTSEGVSGEEAAEERRELEKAIREFLGDVAEPNGRKETPSGNSKGKGKATQEPPKRPPPRPFVEEVPDEEASGFARKEGAFFTEVESVVVPPPVPPKVGPEPTDIPHVQSPSPAHTSTPPPVPKKTPIDVFDDERKNITIHAPEHDDAGDSDSSDDDDEDDLAAPTSFSPRVNHSSRMHNFTGHPNSIPSSPFRPPHYQPYNPYITPCEAAMNERADVLRGLQRARDVQNRAAETMRMFPRDDGFPINGTNPDILRHRMTFPTFPPGFQPPPPPPPPQSSGPPIAPHTHMPMPGMPSFPGVRASPPRMTPMPHQPTSPGSWSYMGFPQPRFGGESHFCPLFEHSHSGLPSFMTSPPQHPPPPPPPPPPLPFAPQPPYADFFPNYPVPSTAWMGDMGMYSRYMPVGQQSPSPAQQMYNAAIKRALAGIPMPTLQDQLQNPQLSRTLWEEIERVASEVPVPHGAVAWAGMPFEEMFRIRLEASEEAVLRGRRVGEEGIDHRDVSLEEEDDEERNMDMPMENPFATPPRVDSPAHMVHHSRPGSMQGAHMPTFPSSRPASGARIFHNFRPSPVPITPASPAPLHSPFIRRDSPFIARGHIRRQSLESNRSMNMGNSIYGQYMSTPVAIASDHGSARRSTPAIPVVSYSHQSAPAVPVDHRHMPSAPAVPGDTDAFEMSSPLLSHLPPHRPVMNPLLHNLHRGTPPVPEVPEDDNTHDEGSKQPQSSFMSHGHHNYPLPFPSHGGAFVRNTPPPPPPPPQSSQPPVPPVHRDFWAAPISPLLRGLPRANTFPAAFPPQHSQPLMPGSFPSHFGNFRQTSDEMSIGSRNPFFQGEGMGLGGMQGIRHTHAPPTAFWPADVDDDDDDEEDDPLRRGRAMGRQYSILTDDDDGFSFRSEEDRRGRSPTARGPRAQPGNYTPPCPPKFKIEQHLRELAGEKVVGEEEEDAKVEEQGEEQQRQYEEESAEDDDDDNETVQDEGEVQQREFEQKAEQLQRREQHEPSAPNTPTQQTYRLPGGFESQLDFLEQFERGVESFVLPQALPPPPPPHAEISVFAEAAVAAELEAEREEINTPVSSPPCRHPRNSPLPAPPVPFSYPYSPSPPRTPILVLRPLRINRESNTASSPSGRSTEKQPVTHVISEPSQLRAQPSPPPVVPSLFHNFAGPSSRESSNAALSLLPSHHSLRPPLDARIDECMAQLIDMGYADDDGDIAMDKLRMYARHADGDLITAVELLAEDAGAWEERERQEAKTGGSGQAEGWRYAGWY